MGRGLLDWSPAAVHARARCIVHTTTQLRLFDGGRNFACIYDKVTDISFYDIPSDDSWTKMGDLPGAINTSVCDHYGEGNTCLLCDQWHDSRRYALCVFRRKNTSIDSTPFGSATCMNNVITVLLFRIRRINWTEYFFESDARLCPRVT